MPETLGILDLLENALREDDWGNDGLLHASTDLVGPLRHTMLRMAGAPERPETWGSLVTLRIGKELHDWFEEALRLSRKPVMTEVSITDGLPQGWTGTADILLWSAKYRGFILYDLKTQKGESLQYIERDGAKTEHIWQASAYWHALVQMGLPMVDRAGIIYLPKNEDYSAEEPIEPKLAIVKPIKRETLWQEMYRRQDMVDTYLRSLPAGEGLISYQRDPSNMFFLNDMLAPPEARVQRMFKNKDIWEIKLVPHWTAQFCRYDDELCDCGHNLSGNKTTKIGQFVKTPAGWVYEARKGYELVEPEVKPAGKLAA